MRRINGLLVAVLVGMAVFFGMFSSRALAADPLEEEEPNNSCATAQPLGAVGAELTLNGRLDGRSEYPAPEDPPNLDFFAITATPSRTVEIELRRAAEDGLGDPYLGVFSGDCAFLQLNDDSGGDLNAQLAWIVPADGELVIAATSCCDANFTQGGLGIGNYTLTVRELPPIGSISGQLIDQQTGDPLDPADEAEVDLLRCFNEDCSSSGTVATTTVDATGNFRFDGAETPTIVAGRYRVLASALDYNQAISPVFTVGADEDLELDPLALLAARPIGSISGQLIDAETGQPVSGSSVGLFRCSPVSCEFISALTSDAEGRFSFNATTLGSELLSGTYQIDTISTLYEFYLSERFVVEPGASRDLGQIGLMPIPKIAAISARLVDAVTGKPISGGEPTFARALLLRVNDDGSFSSVDIGVPDADGRVRFTALNSDGQPIRPGTFVILGYADQYLDAVSESFTVGEAETVDAGDVALQPNPLRLVSGDNCGTLPDGGACRYNVVLVNNQARADRVKVWSGIYVEQPTSSVWSFFQPQPAQTVWLPRGEEKTVRFQMNLPGTVAPGTLVCPYIFVADNVRAFYYQPEITRIAFCLVKEGNTFRRVSDDERVQLMNAMRGVPEGQRNRR